jgi:hypothetical protein
MFLWRDIELASKIDFYGNDYFLKIHYPDKETFFLVESFRIFQELLELPVAKISGWKGVVKNHQFFPTLKML